MRVGYSVRVQVSNRKVEVVWEEISRRSRVKQDSQADRVDVVSFPGLCVEGDAGPVGQCHAYAIEVGAKAGFVNCDSPSGFTDLPATRNSHQTLVFLRVDAAKHHRA